MTSTSRGHLGPCLVIHIDGDPGETYPFGAYFKNDLYMEYIDDYSYDSVLYGGWVYRDQPEYPMLQHLPEVVNFLTERLGWVVRTEAW